MGHPGARLAVSWMRAWAAAVHDRRSWLTELDAAIGDGDHGINLDRGLMAVAADLGATPAHADGGEVLIAAGRRLMAVVGGASGALYGRALVRAGESVGDADDAALIAERALVATIDAIAALGKAVAGDKTMLDALIPALDALAAAPGGEAATRVRRAADAAESGAAATVPMVARKGRASYLGDRSAGHLDPGAASAALMVRTLADALDAG